MRFPGFIGPSYTLGSKNVDRQECINWYPELNELGTGKDDEVAALIPTPGLLTLAEIGDGPIRAEFTASNGEFFVVSGDKLYSVDSAWAATEEGTLNTSTGNVSIADNGIDLVFVDGTDGYQFTFSSDTFATITDPDYQAASQVTYQDGYFIFVMTSGAGFFISRLNAVTFDAADVAAAEGSPDDLVAAISDHRELWLFGAETAEVFYNSGNSDFPFERIEGAFIEHGIAAAFSAAKMDNVVFWLGQDKKGKGMVFQAEGYQPQRISTHAVEIAIKTYGDISGTVAYTYQENGHSFYVLNFVNASTTWVYDVATRLWHERVYSTAGTFERHRANSHAFAHTKHVVGDYVNGKIYELSSSTYTDDGGYITRRRTAPHISKDMNRIFHSKFELDVETGVGIDGSGQGDDPKIILRFSDDHGHTWSNEKWKSIGKIGERFKRVIWNRLGKSRDRVYEITVTDPVKVTLLGVELDITKGAS